ncbi:hypothetical protein I7I50_08969 [Histoplasma capsulatum G186AR]|uniref:Uncharacterized protein n=1 Tax=Ajellomyces capsulatus TaxID=5037 RepID=A0A8H8D006_AJECA|nr:hypothetical protein I7I52_06484 [Histoplasma capsulatum]QSS73997.1 hypothetical protein I7I50_08969 [Histoplasma capsulatum G186AR]
MMHIQHTRNPIEPKPVKLILLHPEPQVTQQEPQHFMIPVIKQPAIPQLMLPLGTRVEIQIIRPVKHIQPVQHILGCMAMHHIQQHHQPQAMCGVDELLQLLWRAVAAAGCKEIVDLISKTGVVCMFHDSHELDGIVSQAVDAREHVLCKLLIGSHAGLGGGDADVGLVDAQAGRFRRVRVFEGVAVLRGWVPEYGVEFRRDGKVLRDPFDPGWEAVELLAGWGSHGYLFNIFNRFESVYLVLLCTESIHSRMAGRKGIRATHLDLAVMRNDGNPVLRRHCYLPNSKVILLHGRRLAIPIIWKKSQSPIH